ncbi:MAG: ABC transporter substrate-binding protein, partial [Brevinema sp.]
DFAQKYPEVVQTFREAHQEAVDYMNSNLEEALILASEALQISTNEVKDLLPHYNFDPTLSSTDRSDLITTQEFLYSINLIENEIDINSIILQ